MQKLKALSPPCRIERGCLDHGRHLGRAYGVMARPGGEQTGEQHDSVCKGREMASSPGRQPVPRDVQAVAARWQRTATPPILRDFPHLGLCMTYRLKPLLLALLPCLGAWGPAQAAEPAVDRAAIDAVFAAFGEQSPGCALGVYRAGEILYAKGYGLADLNHGVPIRPDTVFDIGSSSKQFTAAAVLLLVQDGKLGLDDAVQQHLPELAKALPERFTVRQMLQHSAGLNDYTELMLLAGHALEGVTGDTEALQALLAAPTLHFKPGTGHSYSNSGYFLAALLVERVSGQKLDALLQARVFQPLGMAATHVRTDHTQVVPNRATAYAPTPTGFAIEMSNWNQAGDGAVQSTVLDLARWDAELNHPKVLRPALVETLRTPGRLADGRQLNYGMGLMLDQDRGLPRTGHGGAWAGYRALTVQYPQQRLGLAVTCNLASANPNALAHQVASLLLAGQFTLPAEGPASAAQTFAGKPFEGYYFDPQSRSVLQVRPDPHVPGGTDMRLGHGGAPLRLIGPQELQSASGNTRLIWSANGQQVDLQRRTDKAQLQFQRLPAFKPPPAQHQALVGRYAARGLGHAAAAWELLLQDGGLAVRAPGQEPEGIKLLTPELLHGPGFVLQVRRDAQGRVLGFEYNNERVKGLMFSRVR